MIYSLDQFFWDLKNLGFLGIDLFEWEKSFLLFLIVWINYEIVKFLGGLWGVGEISGFWDNLCSILVYAVDQVFSIKFSRI